MDVGDLITLAPHFDSDRCAAVVTYAQQGTVKCVFLRAEDAPGDPTSYHTNRFWYLTLDSESLDYDVQPLTDPTDEQCAAAMHIMLTGYVPGVDDE